MGGKESAALGVVTGAINQYVSNGKADPAVSENRGLTSHEVAVS